MVKNELRNYETVFILDALMEDGKVDSLANKYADFLNKNGCSEVKADKWGRKKFSYPIKNKYSGFYVSIEFSGKGNVVSKLERNYKLDDTILRYLTMSFDKNLLKEKRLYFEKKQIEAANKEKEAVERLTEASPDITSVADTKSEIQKEK
ncbi:MAG: 30S ribosomal protein S6 [Ignavibacteria bacterium]